MQNGNAPMDTENELMITKGDRGQEKLGVWDEQIYCIIYKIDNQQRPTV